jgi:hypothetical protein
MLCSHRDSEISDFDLFKYMFSEGVWTYFLKVCGHTFMFSGPQPDFQSEKSKPISIVPLSPLVQSCLNVNCPWGQSICPRGQFGFVSPGLVHLVRVMRPPRVSGGASLDKVSNHLNSLENPRGWLSTKGLRFLTVTKTGHSLGLRNS